MKKEMEKGEKIERYIDNIEKILNWVEEITFSITVVTILLIQIFIFYELIHRFNLVGFVAGGLYFLCIIISLKIYQKRFTE